MRTPDRSNCRLKCSGISITPNELSRFRKLKKQSHNELHPTLDPVPSDPKCVSSETGSHEESPQRTTQQEIEAPHSSACKHRGTRRPSQGNPVSRCRMKQQGAGECEHMPRAQASQEGSCPIKRSQRGVASMPARSQQQQHSEKILTAEQDALSTSLATEALPLPSLGVKVSSDVSNDRSRDHSKKQLLPLQSDGLPTVECRLRRRWPDQLQLPSAQ